MKNIFKPETNTDSEKLADIIKKRLNRKRILLSVMSVVYLFLFIPLIKLTEGKDYSIPVRILFTTTEIMLIVQNAYQSSSMKKQIADISENTAEKIASQLGSCPNFRNIFYLTDDHLFSTEGLILPYYEITDVITNSYAAGTTSSTYIFFVTRQYGKIYVPVGLGIMKRDFYEALLKKCPSAELRFKLNYQKANIDEYYNTIAKDSLTIVRDKKK